MNFTYLLGWTQHEKFYYGVRYGETALPESVGTTYWSSSTYVHDFIKTHGNPDLIEIRKFFDTPIAAREWERNVLRRLNASQSSRWLNKANNDCFKGIVMTDEIRQKISSAKMGKKYPGKYYTDGVTNIICKEECKVPPGFYLGRTSSEKQKSHVEKLNATYTHEKRRVTAQRARLKTVGVKKPEGHGERVSAALRGKEKPWARGEKNVSKRIDVRKKISMKRKGTVMYTNGIRNIYALPGAQPEGFIRGRTNTKL
jgi:hypothetical protein